MPPADWVLVIPPLVKASEPTPGVLALAGHLRGRGLRVSVADTNLWVQEALLSADNLNAAATGLEIAGADAAQITSARRAARGIDRSLDDLRRPETYRDPTRYRASLARVSEAYRAVSRARGFRVGPAALEIPGISPLSSADLARVAREPETVPLAPELAEATRRILEPDPTRVAISVTFLTQAVPAFALAGLLRRAGFRGDLVLGGALISSWAPLLGPGSPVFDPWDAVVVGPGEEALAAWAAGRPDAPGVRAPGKGVWREPDPLERATVHFAPDPAGLPWDRYLSPGPVLPVAASRGCYWQRCAFCPEAAHGPIGFRRGDPAGLANSLRENSRHNGASWLHLTDEAVPVSHLRALARGLIGAGVPWYGFARPEPSLADPRLARGLARGGCRMLQLGVESASQRLLDTVDKGLSASRTGDVVHALAGAGIRTYVYLLFGLPTETRREAEATLDWARRHADSITFLNLALFHLPRGSRLEQEAPSHGIKWVPEAREPDLSLYRAFENRAGWGRASVRRLLSQTRGDPVLGPILRRVPPGFTANHAAFCPLPAEGLCQGFHPEP